MKKTFKKFFKSKDGTVVYISYIDEKNLNYLKANTLKINTMNKTKN